MHIHVHDPLSNMIHSLLFSCVSLAIEAINFRITQDGHSVLGLHTGSSLTMFCEGDKKPSDYVKGKLEIPSVTRNHSGMYVCKGAIEVVGSDQEAHVFLGSLTTWELIVYGK